MIPKKNMLGTAGQPTTALPSADQLIKIDRSNLEAMKPPKDTFLIAINESVPATDPSYYRFVSRDEAVDLQVARKFVTLPKTRLDELLDHPVIVGQNGLPILTGDERKMVALIILLQEDVLQNPDLSVKEKRALLAQNTKLINDHMVANEKRSAFEINHYRVNSLITGASAGTNWTPFEEKMARFPTSKIEQLLGRPIERGGAEKKHMLTNEEADFLGMAMGLHEAIQVEPAERMKHVKFGAGVRKAAALYGNPAAKRLTKFLRSEMSARIGLLQDDLERLKSSRAAAEEIKNWIAMPLVLQRPEGSNLHKIREAMTPGGICLLYTDQLHSVPMLDAEDLHGFVVEHDWANAFGGAGEFDFGEFALPYPVSYFEFKVSNRRVGVMVSGDEEGTLMFPVFAWSGGFAFLPEFDLDLCTGKVSESSDTTVGSTILKTFLPLMELLARNVRAICISLEAEVTEVSVVRADHRLNRAREKRGKLPIYDYHVISLAHRTRAAPLERGDIDPDREIARRRCYFVRTHWRHYDNHKTKIKWHLRGDPDLGFVDKHYRV